MNKIAYIEIDTHAEIALNFLEIMNSSTKFSVDYYFSKKTANIIQKKQNINIVNPRNILSELEKKNYDLIIIGTAHRYFNIFKNIVNQYNTAVIVHNIHFSKASRWEIFRSIFKEDFKFRLKLLFKESLLSAPKIYQNANHQLVLDKSFENTDYQYLPVFYPTPYSTQNSDRLRVVIPGGVSQKRRDYQHILRKIPTFKTNIEFIFCGKATGKELEWLKNVEKTLPKNIIIRYFTEKLNNENYHNIMTSADMLWCPIQRETSFMNIPEFYGKTKMSGNIGDAIKYSKPAIFPKNYHSDFDFIIREEEDIEQQFYDILSKKFNFEDFKKEKIVLHLEQILEKLMKK